MPNDRKRNDDLDDITGRRQIISPRDSQSGLPSGVLPAEAADVTNAADRPFGDIEFDVVASTTDALGVSGQGAGDPIPTESLSPDLDGVEMLNNKNPELGVRADSVWDDTDIVHVVPDGAAEGHLIDTSTGEILWAHEDRGQDIEVENDETHIGERSDGPRHVRGVVQKRAPGSEEGFLDKSTPILMAQETGLKYADIELNVGGADLESISFAVGDDAVPQGISEANALWQPIESEVAPDASLPELDV